MKLPDVADRVAVAASTAEKLATLKWMLPMRMSGIDSYKRQLAIELLAGPADGEQTDRLATLAIAIIHATRGEVRQ